MLQVFDVVALLLTQFRSQHADAGPPTGVRFVSAPYSQLICDYGQRGTDFQLGKSISF